MTRLTDSTKGSSASAHSHFLVTYPCMGLWLSLPARKCVYLHPSGLLVPRDGGEDEGDSTSATRGIVNFFLGVPMDLVGPQRASSVPARAARAEKAQVNEEI
jgi:hypothetical protein